jgi:hypothetical protein
MEETIKFLKENIKEEPSNILDIACGEGKIASGLSAAYHKSQVYGLDLDWQALYRGIIYKGNFKKAIPLVGNAYDLVKENPNFKLVSPNPKYDGKNELVQVYFKKIERPLPPFDLVTTLNPSYELTTEEVNNLIVGGKLDENRGYIPIRIISIPAKKGGYVFYDKEIANSYAGLYGGLTPNNMTEEVVKEILGETIEEGRSNDLQYVSHKLERVRGGLGLGNTVNLAVLFKKINNK